MLLGLTLPQLGVLAICIGGIVQGTRFPSLSWIELVLLVGMGVCLGVFEVSITKALIWLGMLSDRTIMEIVTFERPMLSSIALAMGYLCIFAAAGNATKRMTKFFRDEKRPLG